MKSSLYYTNQLPPPLPPKPKKCADFLELRYFCMLLGILIFTEEAFQIGQKVNYCRSAVIEEDDNVDWFVYRDLPVVLALRIPALIAAASLINGVRKVSSTTKQIYTTSNLYKNWCDEWLMN